MTASIPGSPLGGVTASCHPAKLTLIYFRTFRTALDGDRVVYDMPRVVLSFGATLNAKEDLDTAKKEKGKRKKKG